MPGGVNSPVRAFKSVGGTPVFAKKGSGAILTDEDNNQYIDYCMSWGPLILGHAHPSIIEAVQDKIALGTSFGMPTTAENELSDLIISNHKYIEQIRFVSSGTEAVMSAVRLARGVTKKDKIIKFNGCYHGHVDALMVQGGSGLATFSEASSAGIPLDFVKNTLSIPLNDIEKLERAFTENKDQIACVIIEPIPANNGLLLQDKVFLETLRSLCDQHHVLLIFDEVISGFRIGFQGAAEHYTIKPDIITFGKVIGGGFPVGAYASSADIMNHISPLGAVYQAGTLSGNPIAMTAGLAQLSTCLQPDFYKNLEEKTQYLVEGVMHYVHQKNYPFYMYHIGSIFWTTFHVSNTVKKASDIKKESANYFSELHRFMLNNGVYLAPSGYEVGFVSAAHTKAQIQNTIDTYHKALDFIFQGG